MKKILLFIYLISILFTSLNASIFEDSLAQKEKKYEQSINVNMKSKLNNLFKNMENQSLVTDKNIVYYRPDSIKRRKAQKYIIWTRASVVSFDKGDFYYIVPEGYKIIQEKEGELYIDYDPSKEDNENLLMKQNF